MKNRQEIYYYDSFETDFLETKNQEVKLPKNFKWIKKNPIYNFLAYILYYGVLIFAFFYAKFALHLEIVGKEKLKRQKGYFIYSNHTLKLGDVFNPFLVNFPRKPYLICSKSNLGIPFLGKLLPMAGALPIPENIHDMIKFNKAVKKRAEKHPVVIYPEAHLWPYYTGVRPFSTSSFLFPAEQNKSCFVAVTTFQKNRTTIYIDGPFKNDPKLNKHENAKRLRVEVEKVMKRLAEKNEVEYIKYIKNR